MLDFRVDTFLAVCEYMNFTRASEALNITQPAVTGHIQYIEQLYGVKLFDRNGRKINLTREGEELLTTLKTMRNDESKLRERMKLIQKKKSRIKFGATLTVGGYTLVAPLARYLKAHPDTDICVRYDNTSILSEALSNGEIDFAVVEGNFENGRYSVHPFQTVDYIAVCKKGHKFKKDIHRISDLFCERILLREKGSGTRALLEKALAVRDRGIEDFANVVEIADMHALVGLLKHDCGIAFLYKSAVEEELKSGELTKIDLDDFTLTHDFTFLWNKDTAFHEEYETILEEFLTYAKDDESQS